MSLVLRTALVECSSLRAKAPRPLSVICFCPPASTTSASTPSLRDRGRHRPERYVVPLGRLGQALEGAEIVL